jgi:hypothetical protein
MESCRTFRRRWCPPVLFLVLVLTVASPAAATSPQPRATDAACPEGDIPEDGFRDVPEDNVHEAAIDCAYAHELVRGRSRELFEPAMTLSRAQAASIVENLLSASGAELPASSRDYFADDDGSVHEDAINRLAEAGVVSGRRDEVYDPQTTVTRAELAALAVRGIEYRTVRSMPPGPDHFTDDDGTTHEASIDKAAEAGIAAGRSSDVFEPHTPVRRDQAASVLLRGFELLLDNGYGLCPEEYPPYIRISEIAADPAGDDVQPDDGEYVELRSDWCDNVLLDGWQLRDADGNVVQIDGDYLLRPNETLRVYSGPGEAAPDRYYVDRNEPVWNNDGDTATLHEPGGIEADTYSY